MGWITLRVLGEDIFVSGHYASLCDSNIKIQFISDGFTILLIISKTMDLYCTCTVLVANLLQLEVFNAIFLEWSAW